jgi:hypothetical protein
MKMTVNAGGRIGTSSCHSDFAECGFDFERLCKGYKSFQIQLSAWENRYGDSFDRAFDSPVEKSVMPIPPSEPKKSA